MVAGQSTSVSPSYRSHDPAIDGAGVVASARSQDPRPRDPGVGGSIVPDDPIVIVGAAGRFPGADTLEDYWRLLLEGRVIAADPDQSRDELWRVMRDPDLADKITTLKGGYLSDVAGFDAEYFSVSPREAVKLDPQQRLLLEVVHDALEDAGILRADLPGRNVGVFVGAGSSDYMTLDSGEKRQIDGYHGISNSHGLLANRLSYYYNLKGPSLTIDTACSSSLTALHFAVQSLRHDDLDLAIVGGVNVIACPDLTLAFSQARMLSPTGRCNTFSAAADGYGRAEGVGAVILMSRRRAQQDRRSIRCAIRAEAINQDGRSNGITAPNGLSQVRVIRSAMARAGVTPDDMAYMETHGTGTSLGDAIEFNSLKSLFAEYPDARCFVGSSKANIGHTEAAAGMCGLLKAMLMLEHGVIPPHPVPPPYNTFIGQAGPILTIPQQVVAIDPARARVGISSFGFGGANAHVIVERLAEEEASVPVAEECGPVLILLSSHDPHALLADARTLADFTADPSVTLRGLAAGLATRREHLKYRRAIVAADRPELIARLNEPVVARASGRPKLAFVFPGQGSQYAGMGRSLYRAARPFRDAFDRCAALIEERSGIDMARVLYGEDSNDDAPLLEDTHLGQLALFCFEYALAHFWIESGVAPDFMIGHSLGELVAHAVSCMLALPEAVTLVHERGRLMQAEPAAGAMIALPMSAEEASGLARRLGLPLHIAAINSRGAVVLSGERGAVDVLERHLAARRQAYRRLRTRHAFHSPHFSEAAGRLRGLARDFTVAPGTIPVVGNLTGTLLSPGTVSADYWAEHILRPVQFAQGIETLIAAGVTLFLEVGPSAVLSGSIRRDHGGGAAGSGPQVVSSLERGQSDTRSLLVAAGALFEAGCEPPRGYLDGLAASRGVRLPPRHLRRNRYWTSDAAAPLARVASHQRLPAPANNVLAAGPDSLRHVVGRQLSVMQAQISTLEKRRRATKRISSRRIDEPEGLPE